MVKESVLCPLSVVILKIKMVSIHYDCGFGSGTPLTLAQMNELVTVAAGTQAVFKSLLWRCGSFRSGFRPILFRG